MKLVEEKEKLAAENKTFINRLKELEDKLLLSDKHNEYNNNRMKDLEDRL